MSGEGSVYQRADGRWCAKWKDARGKWRYLYRKSKGEDRKALRAALKDRDEGIIPPSKMTVGALLDLTTASTNFVPRSLQLHHGSVWKLYQMKVLMTLVIVLLLASCAAGQGDGAGSTSTQEETTASGTEETTAHKEETTIQKRAGDANRPPDSILSYGGQEVRGTLGSYCTATACFDVAAMPVSSKQGTLTVPSGSEMVFRYGEQSSPETVKADAFTLNKKGYQVRSSRRSLKVQGSGAERTIPAELPPGEYGVDVFVIESQGDANYTFHVIVE